MGAGCVRTGMCFFTTLMDAKVFLLRFVLSVFFNDVSASVSIGTSNGTSVSVDDMLSFGKLVRFYVNFN